MKYHALFVIFEKAANLKLSSAANYRCCFIVLTFDAPITTNVSAFVGC